MAASSPPRNLTSIRTSTINLKTNKISSTGGWWRYRKLWVKLRIVIKLDIHLQSVFKDQKQENVIISSLSVKTLLTLLAEAAGQDVDSLTRRVREDLSQKSIIVNIFAFFEQWFLKNKWKYQLSDYLRRSLEKIVKEILIQETDLFVFMTRIISNLSFIWDKFLIFLKVPENFTVGETICIL